MLCDVCKQNVATVHLTQIVSQETKKIDLCEACSKEKGVDDPTGFSIADLLLGLGASQELEKSAGGKGLTCPHCSFTQADFKKAGRLGCSECYQLFNDGLETLLKTMHKGTRHVGKVPQIYQQTQDLGEKLKHLQKKLEKAIADEKFEIAASLRDEVRHLRAQLKSTVA